jgi:phosphatidylglycerophosphate synthase
VHSAAITIPFEDRNQLLFYWLAAVFFITGSILDVLDGALARQSDRATPFGSFLDSLSDRVSEGFVLAAIAFVFARAGDDISVVFCVLAVAGSFLVSYARAKAELIGLRGDIGIGGRAERVVVISSGLILAHSGSRSSGSSICSRGGVVDGAPENPVRAKATSAKGSKWLRPTVRRAQQDKVRVAIIGVGNCASSFVQGVEYYKDAKRASSSPA